MASRWLEVGFIFVRTDLVFIFRLTIHVFQNVGKSNQCRSFWNMTLLLNWLNKFIRDGLVKIWKTIILWFNLLFKGSFLLIMLSWILIILSITGLWIHFQLLNFNTLGALIAIKVILCKTSVGRNSNIIPWWTKNFITLATLLYMIYLNSIFFVNSKGKL